MARTATKAHVIIRVRRATLFPPRASFIAGLPSSTDWRNQNLAGSGHFAGSSSQARGFGGFDAPDVLALFNLHFPEQAKWEALVDLRSEPSVAADDKRRACFRIARLSERLPEEVRAVLSERIEFVSTATAHGLGSEIGGAGSLLAIAVGALEGDDADNAITALAFGTEQQRGDAAMIIGSGVSQRMMPLLAALAVDPRSSVRTATAEAVGKLMAIDETGMMAAIARNLASDSGVSIPSAFLRGLSHHLPLSAGSLSRSISEELADHMSARVRRMANQVLNV